ncbi:MAG: spermidine synthase [Bacteriovoracaceae bacterium]
MTDRLRYNLSSFFTGMMVLIIQILVYRVVSAKLINNYAFLIISLTMLGFALSGIMLAKKFNQYLEHAEEFLWKNSLWFVLSLIVCTAIFYRLPTDFAYDFEVTQTAKNANQFLSIIGRLLPCLPIAVLFSFPFIFPGLILGLLLSHPKHDSKELYFSDLLGSAIGSLIVIPLITFTDVENLLLWIPFFFLIIIFALFSQSVKKWAWGLAAIVLVSAFFPLKVYDMVYGKSSMLARSEVKKIVWDPTARIELSKPLNFNFKNFNYPSLIGSNPNFHSTLQYWITQNNFAFTFAPYYDGNKTSLTGIEETIYAAAYMANPKPNPKVFIIGVGGGYDILTGLYFNPTSIHAAEINAATIQILKYDFKDYFKSWVQDPRVNLIIDDGRHALETSPGDFDIIQLSGVDTYSGTPGAANVYAENYLYTKEAIKLYHSKLNSQGILNIMRLEHGFIFPREMLRVLTTTVEALRELGIENPKDHIIMVTSTNWNFTAMLMKKTPFVEADLTHFKTWANGGPNFKLTAWPIDNLSVSLNRYQKYLDLKNEHLEAEARDHYSFNISPVDDDKPFLFKYTFWSHMYSHPILAFMEYNLLIQFSVVLIILALGVYWPLQKIRKELNQVKLFPYTLVASCIGLGFMFYEIALMQKMGLFLGHPNYAISVVLSSLLLSSGLGSLWAKKTVDLFKNMTNVAYALCLFMLIETILFFPFLAGKGGWSFALKTLTCYLAIMPIGMLMGTFIPSLIEEGKKHSPSLSTWTWGINAIFSVLGPILGIAFSTSFGFNMLIALAVPFYFMAGIAFKSFK